MSIPGNAQYSDNDLLAFTARYLNTQVDGVGDWGRTPAGEFRRPAALYLLILNAVAGNFSGDVSIVGNLISNGNLTFERFGTFARITARRTNGTITAPTALLNNDTILTIIAEGYDGANLVATYQSGIKASENWSGTNRGTFVQNFQTLTGTAAAVVVSLSTGDGNWAPGVTATFDLGEDSLRWDNLHLDTALLVGGSQVIADRQTGWTAATGTADRTTFATAAVTLPELAERVKALIDDFLTHGAIGA